MSSEELFNEEFEEEEFCYKYSKTFQEVYTYCNSSSQHFLTEDFDNFVENCIQHIKIKIYGIPYDADDETADEMTTYPDKAIKVGTIEGYLILAKEIEKRGYNLYACCDEESEELEYVISALCESGGVMKANNITEPIDIFYLHEIFFENKEFEDQLYHDMLINLQDIVMSHTNVYPEMLVYYPAPLPYDNRLDQIQRAIATEAAGQAIEYRLKMDAINNDPTIDSDYEYEERLAISEDQINMVLGNRVKGQTYPEEAKNMSIWSEFEFAGFSEWKNTRVLYYIDVR